MVYLGYLEDGTPVAVKMRSETAAQGINEFLGEVINSYLLLFVCSLESYVVMFHYLYLSFLHHFL